MALDFDNMSLVQESEEALPEKRDGGGVLKQALAGIMDIPQAIPAVPGLIHGIARIPGAIERHGSEGALPVIADALDNPSMHVVSKMRDFNNETLGITDPQTTGESLARLSSLLIPTPDKLVTAPAKALSAAVKAGPMLSKGIEMATRMAVPTAQISEKASNGGKLLEYGAQTLIPAAVDQGMRYATNQNSLLDFDRATTINEVPPPEEQHDNTKEWLIGLGALAGAGYTAYRYKQAMKAVPDPAPLAKPMDAAAKDLDLATRMKQNILDRTAPIRAWLAKSGASEDQINTAVGLSKMDPHVVSQYVLADGKVPLVDGQLPKFNEEIIGPLSVIYKKDPDRYNVWSQGMTAIREKLNRLSASFQDLADPERFAKQQEDKIDFYSKKRDILRKEAKDTEEGWMQRDFEANERGEEIDSFAAKNDARKLQRLRSGIAFRDNQINRWTTSAEGPQVIVGKSGREYNLNDLWDNDVRITGDQMSKILDDMEISLKPVGFRHDRVAFLSTGKVVAGNDLMKTRDLEGLITKLKSDPELYGIAKKYTQITDGVLQHWVNSGVGSKALADRWRNEMTIDGMTHYIPGFESKPDVKGFAGYMSKLSYLIGWDTSAGAEMQKTIAHSLSQRAFDVGEGINMPIDPAQSMQMYVSSMLDHTKRATDQFRVLDLMSSSAGDAVAADGLPFVRRIGIMAEPNVPPKYLDKDIRDLVTKRGDNWNEGSILKVQRNGQIEHWWINDPALKVALEASPVLVNGINGMMSRLKSIYHAGTTRNILFGPAQFFYGTGQIMVTAPAHGAVFTPWNAAKGFWQVASTGIAREASNTLKQALNEGSTFFGMSPQYTAQLAKKMEDYVANQFVTKFGQETGGVHSQYLTNELNNNYPDIVKAFGAPYQANYNGWRAAMRYLDIINHAMQDGPLVGLQMKMYSKAAAKKSLDLEDPSTLAGLMHRVNAQSIKAGGDFRALGGSGTAQTIAAWVPYSGAILNGMAAIGGAFKAAPFKSTMALGASVIAPVLAEYLYWNTMASPEERKAYWTQYGDDTRNGGLFVPTGNPDKPIILPLLPEWAFAKSVTMAFLDNLLGMSNDQRDYGKNYLTGNDPTMDDRKKDMRYGMIQSLARVIGIPTPPLIQALAASTGNQINLAPVPGANMLPFNIQKLGGVEKLGGADSGQGRFVDGVFDRDAEGVVAALTGYVGQLLVSTSEAFNIGSRYDLEEGVKSGLETAGQSMAKFVKVTNPLYGEVTRVNPNDATVLHVKAKEDGFKALASISDLMLHPGVANTHTVEPFIGNSSQVAIPQDPVTQQIAMFVGNYAQQDPTQYFRQDNATIQKLLQDIRGADRFTDALVSRVPGYEGRVGQPMSPFEKEKMIDTLSVQAMNNRIMMIHQYDAIEKQVNAQFPGSDFTFDGFMKNGPSELSGVIPPASLTGQSGP